MADLAHIGIVGAGLADWGADATAAAMRATLVAQGGLLQAVSQQWHDNLPTLVRPVRTGLLTGAWHADDALRIGSSAHERAPVPMQGSTAT